MFVVFGMIGNINVLIFVCGFECFVVEFLGIVYMNSFWNISCRSGKFFKGVGYMYCFLVYVMVEIKCNW